MSILSDKHVPFSLNEVRPLPLAAGAFSLPQGQIAKSEWIKVTASGLKIYDALGLEGHEAISDPSLFKVLVRLEHGAKVPDDLVGKPATVTLLAPDKPGSKNKKEKRFFHGLIAAIQEVGGADKDGFRFVLLTLRSKFWFLHLTQDSRTFQEISAQDILAKVLKEKQIEFKDKTKGSGKTKRTFCVMYQESYFHFLSRLMEEEGISYTFVQDKSKETLVLFDKDTGEAAKDPLEYRLSSGTPDQTDTDGLWEFRRTMQAVVTSTAVSDYFQEKPDAKLYNKQPGKTKIKLPLDVYQHPIYQEDLKTAEAAAKRRIEAEEVGHIFFEGRSTCVDLFPGQRVKTTKCYDKELNASYVLTKVVHSYGILGSEAKPQNNNRFQAVPDKTPIRPPLRHRRPSIDGMQTAVVTGKKGEEIFTDKAGRIKIKFYWDTRAEADEKSSCWVRVATSLAGKGWGVQTIPRVGQEVMVQFEEGDPERPVVVGCLYNGKNTPPYNEKTKTSTTIKTHSTPKGTDKNFNELRFTDQKDKEEVFLQAEKDAVMLVKDARTTTVQKGNDETTLESGDRVVTLQGKDGGSKGKGDDKLTLEKGSRTIVLKEGDLTTTLDKGSEKHTLKKGDQTITIDSGNQTIKISKGKRSVTIKSNDSLDISGGWKVSVKGKMSISAKGGISFDTPGAFSVSCTSFKVNAKASAAIDAKASAQVKGGASLQLKGGATAALEGGAMVNVKGGAMASVKAGIIQLN